MRSKRSWSAISVTLTLSLALLAPLSTAHAASYPGNTCVAAKQRAAASFCRAAFTAWKLWERSQNDTARDASIAKAGQTLATVWVRMEQAASRQNVDCADTTLSAAGMQTQVAAAVAAIAAGVNTGLTLTTRSNATCGAALLGAAGSDCAALLGAEAGYVARLSAGKAGRDRVQTSARGRFQSAFTRATAVNCPTAATAVTLQTAIDALAAGAVTNTTVSPHVDNTQFTTISPTGTVTYQRRSLTPLCSRGTPYYFFAKRGSVNKLVMYYEGGGACWDYLTCSVGTFNQSIDPNGGDNPQNQQAGFGDLSNPNNPFKDWNIVFTSYCTGDIHFGDAHQDYLDPFSTNVTHVNHFGYQNARVVEKWAREHFVNPDEVFVTGSSAGAYGAFFNAPLLEDVWPDSKFSVLADAGNGVTTPSFIQNNFASWNFVKNTPNKIPGVLEAIQSGAGIPEYTQAVAAFFPNTAWAHYATAYDGSTGGQTGFYNVMLHPGQLFQWLNWWQETCAWHDLMVQQAAATAKAVPTNYRYYIGRGSRHTGWGSNTVVYNDDTIGGTPALKDWVTSMGNRDGGWVNVECGVAPGTDCETLLPNDPAPSPLQAPFQQNGPDVEVACP